MDENRYADTPLRPLSVPEEHAERRSDDIVLNRPTSDERMTALVCHLGMFLMAIFLALIVWLLKRETSRFVDEHGREAVNYQLTRFIVAFPIALLVMLGIVLGISSRTAVVVVLSIGCGVLVGLVLFVLDLVWCIRAMIAAHHGESYRYPLCIRFF